VDFFSIYFINLDHAYITSTKSNTLFNMVLDYGPPRLPALVVHLALVKNVWSCVSDETRIDHFPTSLVWLQVIFFQSTVPIFDAGSCSGAFVFWV
jgi:hypothetical protein